VTVLTLFSAAKPDQARAALQRARGEGSLVARFRSGRTEIDTLYQEGCAKIRLPHTHDESLQAVLINTAGGLTGGDVVAWSAEAGQRTRLVLTTQACERIYRSLGDKARVTTRIAAGPDARIDWLPQETILFEGARLDRRLEVDLAGSAAFTAVEAVLLGRAAMGEDARNVHFRDNWRIRRNGRLIHAEATELTGETLEREGLSLLAGARAFATILHLGSAAERKLEAIRPLLSPTAGASLVGERLTVRLIAESGLALRRVLAPIIAVLSGAGSVPRLWNL
jgi:urease accessory protein